MRAIVVYSTRFGNTGSIAISLASGLKQAGLEVDTSSIEDTVPDKMAEYDLIAIGGPTEFLTASKSMKDFLKYLAKVSLKSKYGFAFDTKLESRFSGSAAKFIEKSLEKNGLTIVHSKESAIVYNQKEKEHASEIKLKEGMRERFVTYGKEIGTLLQGLQSHKVDTA